MKQLDRRNECWQGPRKYTMPILPSQKVKSDLIPSADLLKQLKQSKEEGDGVTDEDFKRLLESH